MRLLIIALLTMATAFFLLTMVFGPKAKASPPTTIEKTEFFDCLAKLGKNQAQGYGVCSKHL